MGSRTKKNGTERGGLQMKHNDQLILISVQLEIITKLLMGFIDAHPKKNKIKKEISKLEGVLTK